MSTLDDLLSDMRDIRQTAEAAVWGRAKEAGILLAKIDPQQRKPLMRQVRLELLFNQGRRCPLCGEILTDAIIEEDHIVPIAYGGGNERANFRLLCGPCNRQRGKTVKGHVDLAHFIQYIEDRVRNLPAEDRLALGLDLR